MPVRVSHVLDATTHEDAVRLVTLLLRRLPRDRVEQRVAVMGDCPALQEPPDVPVVHVGRRLNWPMASVLDLQRVLRRQHPQVVLAWGPSAAAVSATAAGQDPPMAAVVADPAEAAETARWWPGAAAESFGQLVCTSDTARRRLIEHGLPAHRIAVIRPGIDYGELRQARLSADRRTAGLPAGGTLLVTASPPSRAAGQYYAAWAAAILQQVWPDVTMVVPGVSREQERIRRLVEGLPCRDIYRFTRNRISPMELLSLADVLVFPPPGDAGTYWLAMAMAAGTTIVATAVPSVTELVADGQTAFLCEPDQPHLLAARIHEAVGDPDTRRRCAEAVQGQAFEAFRAETCIEAFLRLITDAVQGRAAAGASA